jgi:hypothetical protein
MTPSDSTKSHRKCVEFLDATLEFAVPVLFDKSQRSILPVDAELTCTADVNEQLSIKLVRHCYSLLVFVGREGRLWDDCQRSKVRLFTKKGLLAYLLNCPDIQFFPPKQMHRVLIHLPILCSPTLGTQTVVNKDKVLKECMA